MSPPQLRHPRVDAKGRDVDSDLAESISALKESFQQRGIAPSFGKAESTLVDSLKKELKIPRRYRDFLLNCDPTDVETATPSERVRLVPASELVEEQKGFCITEDGSPLMSQAANGWRPTWVIIAHSALLGDPYFLDVSEVDAEGDCPVYTAMSGTDTWKPRLCASSFAMFLRILAITLEVSVDFDEDDFDMDNESVFRESVGPRIREYDPAAMKAGHWT